jgi:DNA polymerase I-like protein with 3'-5' exonuclease and polymerase domains
LDHTLIRLDEEIKSAAGEDFNIDSPKQLGEILFEKLKISSKAKKPKQDNTQHLRISFKNMNMITRSFQ